MSFSTLYVEQRTTKSSVFYDQINKIVNWDNIDRIISEYYIKGTTVDGRKPYSGVLLFKMLLLGIWNCLSDERTELLVNDSLSAMKFCGLSLEDNVPDHSTLSRFRSELTQNKGMDKILSAFNKELEKHHIIIKKGVKVDASLTQSPNKPKGPIRYEIATDRKEDDLPPSEKEGQATAIKKCQGKGVDKEARWVKKGGKSIYGYKKHYAVDSNGLVIGVHSTAANEHDSRGMAGLLDKLCDEDIAPGVWADKGYKTTANDALLKTRKANNRIMFKGYRNKPIKRWQVRCNKLFSKSRWVVERTFGSEHKWFNGHIARYKGLEKTHTQHVLQAIAYNLKRSPGIIMSGAQ